VSDTLEDFWQDVLSESAPKVMDSLGPLEDAERRTVLQHLQQMATAEGWNAGQRRRAAFALRLWGERHPGSGPTTGPSSDTDDESSPLTPPS
jgi:hypothetical protein